MGNICDCFNAKQDGPSPRTPLLTGNASPVTAEVCNPASVPSGQSARVHKPEHEKKDFLTSLEELNLIDLATVTTVPSLDKTFQDHGKLYNDLYSSFVDLRKCIHDFKAQFEVDTRGIPIIADCLKILAKRCGGSKLSGSRTKNCIQITYDKKDVSEKCEGPAEDVLETIELYNKVNKLIKSILEKSPQVKSSISLVLEEEQKLKREVTKADPDGRLGPEPLRMTTENFTKLHKLPAYIDTIQKYTSKTFKEIANGSKVLFEDT